MRMMRRAGLLGGKDTSFSKFWADASVVACLGASTSYENYYEGLSVGSTSTPLWVICTKGNVIQTYKFVNNDWSWKRTIKSPDYDDETDVGLQVGIDTDAASTTSSTKLYVTDQQAYYGIYAYALAALRFPSYSESEIDEFLRYSINVEFYSTGYKYGSSASSIYISSTSLSSDANDVYLQFASQTSEGYISATKGGIPDTAIMSSGSRAFWRLSSSSYYFSTTGASNNTTRAGGLYRLYV